MLTREDDFFLWMFELGVDQGSLNGLCRPPGIYSSIDGLCKYCNCLWLKIANLQPNIHEHINGHQLHPSH